MNNPKLIRITTVPISFKVLLNGQHRFMSNNGFEVVGISSDGQEIQDLEQDENIRLLTVEMTRTISPFQDLKSVWQLYKIFKKEKPQIVHTHTPKAGTVGMLAAKLAKVPIRLHTVAGLPLMETKGLKRIVLDWVEKLTYVCSSKVYPNSQGLYDFILENKYTTQDKLKVIGKGSSNGINTSHFNPELISDQQRQNLKNLLGIQPEDFVFIFIGRLVGDKGINELVAAFSQICKSENKPNCKLLLVGWLEPELDSLSDKTLKNIENNPNIISTGFQKDVRPYFAVSNALIFPSYREGFPNVVMQAGAMELPSIVTNINGCNEIIIEGKNGIIIPVKNTEAIKTAMEKLMSDKNYYEKLKENTRIMIVSRYEQSVIWNALLEEYNEIIKKKMYKNYFKRAIDFFSALIGIITLSPVFLLVMTGLFFANQGKPFFFQSRPGKNERIFKIVKFKTMNDKKDENGKLLPDAERLTKIGNFVRKTSLDEIPQLINVLKGDMSLIGPRPLLKQYLPLYNEIQKRRHEIRPGITGWAQVNGRNAISWNQKFEYDVWYVDNISLRIDIKILFLTIKKVFVREGISQDGQATMEYFKGNNQNE